MRYLLDTHTWVWLHMQPDLLSSRVRAILASENQHHEFLLSAISIWKFCVLVQKRKLQVHRPRSWVEDALREAPLEVVPLTPEIACRSTTLPGDFHPDPADRIIVASARNADATVLSKDQRIAQYPHVNTVW